jgi:hypothetical protein
MIPHNYNWASNSTQQWDTSDNEQSYRKNELQLKKLDLWDITIQYKFNSEGFRSSEFDQVDIVALGCSFTMGTGVAQHSTWPAQLAAITHSNIANLGHAGSSNDTAFRFAQYYLPRLRPRTVCWVQTDRHRLEIINDSQQLSTNLMANDSDNVFYGNDNFVKQWFASDSNQTLNLDKNTLAVQHLCSTLNIQCIVIPRSAVPVLDLARDLMHPGVRSYKQIAEQFARQLYVV